MKFVNRKVISSMLLSATLISAPVCFKADASTNDIVKEYYYVDLSVTGCPDDTYELSLPQGGISTYSLEGVNGADDRYLDTNSSVVRIRARYNGMYGNTVHQGTGFIVSDHVIATAAHIVDSYPEYIDRLYDVQVYITDNETGQEVVYDVKEVHVPQDYIDTEGDDYDYALLTVSEDLSEYGTFSLGLVRDDVLDNRGLTVNITGYPKQIEDENGNAVSAENELYTGRGSLIRVNDNRIFFTTDATEGDSGGPAYVQTVYQVGSNAPVTLNTVIGIFSGTGLMSPDDHYTNKKNQATRITEPILQFYRNNPYISY